MTDDRGSTSGQDKSSKSTVWLVIIGVTAAVIAIFIASNTQDTEVQFWWLDTSLPLWSVIIISVTLGVLIGWSLSIWRNRRRKHQHD